ncbi:MAG: DUF547 domain-containing protein [Gemmatimonadaceae bacterium]|nr:DUF547 domain-containing protein [Gemmatimonadaceae bacterium]
MGRRIRGCLLVFAALTTGAVMPVAPHGQLIAQEPARQEPARQDARSGARPDAGSDGRRVDHREWDAVVSRHVRQGQVDYDAVARDPAFSRYLSTLASTTVDGLDEDERLAFWLNAYNAWTVQLIIAHGERESIRNINRTLGVLRLKGPWSEPIGKAAGRSWTLDEVEHRILRKHFREPRIHFALVSAARGAPSLRNEAYTGDRLNDQLDAQARDFLGDTTRNRFVNGVFWLSPIFTYYRSDFAATPAELGVYLAPFFPAGRELIQKGRFFIRQTRFDWSLNGIRPAPPAIRSP